MMLEMNLFTDDSPMMKAIPLSELGPAFQDTQSQDMGQGPHIEAERRWADPTAVPQSTMFAPSEPLPTPVNEVPNLDGSSIKAAINHDISPLELGIYTSQQFLQSAEVSKAQNNGYMTELAAQMYALAARTNAMILPYTHAKLSAADTSNNSSDTINMLEQLQKQREARQQEIIRMYDGDQDNITQLENLT